MTHYERYRAYFQTHRDQINARRRARRRALAAEREAEHREYLDCGEIVRSFTTGKGSRCGFSTSSWNGPKKIAARRREVYARMAKIKDGWRTK